MALSFRYSLRKMVKLFANCGSPDQTPRSAVSDLGLHCLSIPLLGVSRLQWVSYCKQLRYYTKYSKKFTNQST